MNMEMSVWTIWADLPEHPGKHVVRRFEFPIRSPEPLSETVVDSLADARELLPPGLVMARRNEREAPAMLEAWLMDPAITRS
jgi:hypothetical protein